MRSNVLTRSDTLISDATVPSAPAQSTPVPTVRRYGIWPDQATDFSTFRAAPLRHNFHEHPMLQLPKLMELAHDLVPAGLCRFLVPGTTLSSSFRHESKSFDGRSVDEVFERIEEPGSWIALYEIQNIPRYKKLLEEILETVRHLVEPEQRKTILMTGFIFISAPPSVTPFHIDRENNFWLQIKGHKSLTVWDRTDREILPEDVVDEFIVFRSLERVRLTDKVAALGKEMDRGPGEGMFFPSTTPHMTESKRDWVSPGDGVAISIGVNFYTNVTRRHARVHQVNRMMRRFGLKPTPPGKSTWLDVVKAPLGKLVIAVQKRRYNYETPPGQA